MVTLDGAVHGCGDNSSGMIERVSDLLVLDDLPAGHARMPPGPDEVVTEHARRGSHAPLPGFHGKRVDH